MITDKCRKQSGKYARIPVVHCFWLPFNAVEELLGLNAISNTGEKRSWGAS